MSYKATGNPEPCKYGDGTGRNSYIVCDYGGTNLSFWDKQPPPTVLRPKFIGAPTPLGDTKSHRYHNNGTGRDTYVSQTVTNEYSQFNFSASLREPIVQQVKHLRPLSGHAWAEAERHREQQASCSRLSKPKRVSVHAHRQLVDYERDISGAPIRTRPQLAQMRCLGNQRHPKDGFTATTFSRSGHWLPSQK